MAGELRLRWILPLGLLSVGALGWWWSVRMAMDMAAMAETMPGMPMSAMVSVAGFLVGWTAMMAAMMAPALIPAVRLYALAAARGAVAPLPFFLLGYLMVWVLPGLPAYIASRWFAPVPGGTESWVGRSAGLVLLGAAIWQLTPWKSACLRHCRSPLSFFLQYGGRARGFLGATRMGAVHGLFCIGCCWAMMAVLVALGTMNLTWMLALSVIILLEKAAPGGGWTALMAAMMFALAGTALLWNPGWFASLAYWTPLP